MNQETKPPIKSGWKGNINGFVENTNSHIEVSEITLKLDRNTAWALCNLLTDNQLQNSSNLEASQVICLSQLGAALGRMIDHSSANNGGRQIIK